MNVSQILSASPLPLLDSEVLLAHVLGKGRSWLYAHGEQAVRDADLQRWKVLAGKRMEGEPVAYLTGTQEFYGRPFAVTRDVLIPRPSTEGLVEAVLELLKGERGNGTREIDEGIVAFVHAFGVPAGDETILDVGTGSGCIAITLALNLPHAKIVAVDVSKDALEVARVNAELHGVGERIEFIHDDGIDVVRSSKEPFVLVSNPPYIPDALETELMKSVTAFEPHLALFAGPDGLSVLDPLLRAANRNPLCAGIAVECREDQAERLRELLER